MYSQMSLEYTSQVSPTLNICFPKILSLFSADPNEAF